MSLVKGNSIRSMALTLQRGGELSQVIKYRSPLVVPSQQLFREALSRGPPKTHPCKKSGVERGLPIKGRSIDSYSRSLKFHLSPQPQRGGSRTDDNLN
ncbi:hypothetical protein TNCV_1854341 [Trichonephila clavipes]|nr:hypothetical protein TNCV_1854341 [Trichonephila clavipes]